VIFDSARCVGGSESSRPAREDRGFWGRNLHRKGVGVGAEIGITERAKGF
jgi:hypothetical protein